MLRCNKAGAVRVHRMPIRLRRRRRRIQSRTRTMTTLIGSRRNGRSSDRSSKPGSSIQKPSTGRNPNRPHATSKRPTGIRSHRADGLRNQRRARPARTGSSRCQRSRWRSSRRLCLSTMSVRCHDGGCPHMNGCGLGWAVLLGCLAGATGDSCPPEGQRKPALTFASIAAPGQSCLSPSVLNATGAVSRCACKSGASGSTYNNPVTISPRAWAACR